MRGRGVFAYILRLSRAGGNPGSEKLNALDPRLRGDDVKNTPMTQIIGVQLFTDGAISFQLIATT